MPYVPKSADEKRFVDKHVIQLIKKYAGKATEDDNLFKAKNIKKSKRKPHHGYEPGEDEAVYEAYELFSSLTEEEQDEIMGELSEEEMTLLENEQLDEVRAFAKFLTKPIRLARLRKKAEKMAKSAREKALYKQKFADINFDSAETYKDYHKNDVRWDKEAEHEKKPNETHKDYWKRRAEKKKNDAYEGTLKAKKLRDAADSIEDKPFWILDAKEGKRKYGNYMKRKSVKEEVEAMNEANKGLPYPIRAYLANRRGKNAVKKYEARKDNAKEMADYTVDTMVDRRSKLKDENNYRLHDHWGKEAVRTGRTAKSIEKKRKRIGMFGLKKEEIEDMKEKKTLSEALRLDEDCASQYDSHYNAALSHLRTIEKHLKAHKRALDKSSANSGHAHSMKAFARNLEDKAEALSSAMKSQDDSVKKDVNPYVPAIPYGIY